MYVIFQVQTVDVPHEFLTHESNIIASWHINSDEELDDFLSNHADDCFVIRTLH